MKLLSKKEAADLLGVSTRTIDRYVKSGILQGYRRGPQKSFYIKDDVESVLKPIIVNKELKKI